MACHVVDDSVETYLGSAALFELTFLDSPESRAGGYPERWGMVSLLGVEFVGSVAGAVGRIPDEDDPDTKTRFDDIEDDFEEDDDDDDDDDDFDDDDEDDDDFDDEDDDEDDDDFDDF